MALGSEEMELARPCSWTSDEGICFESSGLCVTLSKVGHKAFSRRRLDESDDAPAEAPASHAASVHPFVAPCKVNKSVELGAAHLQNIKSKSHATRQTGEDWEACLKQTAMHTQHC